MFAKNPINKTTLAHKSSTGKSYHSTLNSISDPVPWSTKVYKIDQLCYDSVFKNPIDSATKHQDSKSSSLSKKNSDKNKRYKSSSLSKRTVKKVDNSDSSDINKGNDTTSCELLTDSPVCNTRESGSLEDILVPDSLLSREILQKPLDLPGLDGFDHEESHKDFSPTNLVFSKISRSPLKIPPQRKDLNTKPTNPAFKRTPRLNIKLRKPVKGQNQPFSVDFSPAQNLNERKDPLPTLGDLDPDSCKQEYFNQLERENSKLVHLFEDPGLQRNKPSRKRELVRRSTIANCKNTLPSNLKTTTSVEPKHSLKPTISFNKHNITQQSFLLNTPLAEYKLIKSIGKGSYGRVDLMRNIISGKLYAVKTIKRYAPHTRLKSHPEYKKSVTLDTRVIREANLGLILGQIHPHITCLYDLRMTDTHFYMFYEYVKGPTLAERVGEDGIDEDQARNLFKPIVQTISKFLLSTKLPLFILL
ncbi:Serine/threonine protein kinase KIN1 [Smittium mucronatum]|uniref:Serine/threonine protein kinase KIN1 n=1 Tax=Smittium mucronatum TaxID=133383 RepID=A0A1R0H8I0_9FUNG|nr:Serine/threonine protein kinase KIN1 [Smittium mucronatum]